MVYLAFVHLQGITQNPQELPRTSQGTQKTLKDALGTRKVSQEQLRDPHGENKNKEK